MIFNSEPAVLEKQLVQLQVRDARLYMPLLLPVVADASAVADAQEGASTFASTRASHRTRHHHHSLPLSCS